MQIHGVNQRQIEIIEILKKKKFVSCADLSIELNVALRTIKYDIAYLKKAYPNKLITHRGKYGGGIEWIE